MASKVLSSLNCYEARQSGSLIHPSDSNQFATSSFIRLKLIECHSVPPGKVYCSVLRRSDWYQALARPERTR